MAKPLKFYDLREKKSFQTNEYEVVERKGRKFAKTTSPSGTESWKAVSKDFNSEGEN